MKQFSFKQRVVSDHNETRTSDEDRGRAQSDTDLGKTFDIILGYSDYEGLGITKK